MIYENTLIVLDWETGSVDIETLEPLSIGAVAINPKTLTPVPGERGTFYSLMKPLNFDNLQQRALDVNGLTKEELAKAPDQKLVWELFTRWVYGFNPKGKYFNTAPIACGKNIRHFDMPIVQRMAKTYENVDKNGVQNLFHRRYMIDVEDDLYRFFGHTDVMENMKLDTVRKHFGMSTANAHNALEDCRQTAQLIIAFFELYRSVAKNQNYFRGAFAQEMVA